MIFRHSFGNRWYGPSHGVAQVRSRPCQSWGADQPQRGGRAPGRPGTTDKERWVVNFVCVHIYCRTECQNIILSGRSVLDQNTSRLHHTELKAARWPAGGFGHWQWKWLPGQYSSGRIHPTKLMSHLTLPSELGANKVWLNSRISCISIHPLKMYYIFSVTTWNTNGPNWG